MEKRQTWEWHYSTFAFNSGHFLQTLCQFTTSSYLKPCLFLKQGLQFLSKNTQLHNCGQVPLHQEWWCVFHYQFGFAFLAVVYLLSHYCHSSRACLQKLFSRSFSEMHTCVLAMERLTQQQELPWTRARLTHSWMSYATAFYPGGAVA